jgi:serine/threonine-protein kinase
MDAHEVDGRSDVYSLGCTLHYLLRGGPPYRRDNAALILLAHCQDAIPDLTSTPGVTERLNAVFQRMMAKKNFDRFATMVEVVAELETCQRELAGQSVPPLAPRKPVQPAPTVEPALTMRDEPAPAAATNRAATDDPPEAAPQPEVILDEVAITDVAAAAQAPGSDSAMEFVTSSMSDPFGSIGEMMLDKPPARRRRSPKFWLSVAGGAIAALAVGGWAARDWLASLLRSG